MKYFYLGIGILAVILLLSLLCLGVIGGRMAEIGTLLEEAWGDCKTGRFDRAKLVAEKAKSAWEAGYGLTASFADHGDLNEVDQLFAQMEACGVLENWDEFAQVCRQLITLVEDVSQRQKPLYYNFL